MPIRGVLVVVIVALEGESGGHGIGVVICNREHPVYETELSSLCSLVMLLCCERITDMFKS